MRTDLSTVKNRFFDLAVGDILRAIRGGSLMGAFTLSVCAIDAMAYLGCALPRKRNRQNFVKWVDTWMVPLNPRCLPDVLYALRCGLVHTYGYAEAMGSCGVERFQCVHNRPTEHWRQASSGACVLNLDSHVAEVIVAAFTFFDHLSSMCREDKLLAAAVERRVEKLMSLEIYRQIALDPGRRWAIVRSLPDDRRYGEMDPTLAPLDENGPPQVADIEREIAAICAAHSAAPSGPT